MTDLQKIQKLRQRQRTKQYFQDIDALLDVFQHLYRTVDVSELFALIVEKAVALTEAERGCLILVDGDKQWVEVAKSKDGTCLPGETFQVSQTVINEVLAKKEGLTLTDTWSDNFDSESIADLNIRMVVAVPLVTKDVVGVLYVDSTDPGEQILELRQRTLMALASQAAVAIEQAKMFTQLQALYRKTQVLDQAKMDFIQIASHELRTPLTAISGYIALLETLDLPDEGQEFVGGLQRGAGRLGDIINVMLDVTTMDQGQFAVSRQPYLLLALLTEAMAPWQADARERNIHLSLVDDSEKSIICSLDARYMDVAIGHLVQNAIKFTPNKGKITMRLEETDHCTARIEVIDNGIGISVEHYEAVFEKFFRVGRVNGHSTGRIKFMGAGPGLGLFLVRGIVEAHQGKIWVESEGVEPDGGIGAKFIIELPLLREESGQHVQSQPNNLSWGIKSKQEAELIQHRSG